MLTYVESLSIDSEKPEEELLRDQTSAQLIVSKAMIYAYFDEGKVIETIDKVQVLRDRNAADKTILRCLVRGLTVLAIALDMPLLYFE